MTATPPTRSGGTRHHIFRFHTKTAAQLEYLEDHLTITKTDVVRLAIARLYDGEKRREAS
jgi:hypothetical protein